MKIPILPKVRIDVEQWKWNDEFQIYVSSKGNFRDAHKHTINPKINEKGYLTIPLDGQYRLAHRLVLFTFKPRMGAANLTVDHLDHNKRNNSIKNLEWVTEKENARRAQADLVPMPQASAVTKKIMANQRKFDSIDAAVDWVLDYTGNETSQDPANKDNIKERINHAISNGKKYCGMNWRRQ